MREIRFVVFCLGVAVAGCAPPPQSTIRGSSDPRLASPVTRPDSSPADATGLTGPDPGSSIVATARAQIGTPYRYGGGDANGFDCSGLVHNVFRRHGVRLPRRSVDQYRRGALIPPDDLRPGDLVFFAGSGGTINHVGIWSGHGRFVHASRSRGVVEDSADSAWFRRRFVGGRRVRSNAAK